MKKSDNVTNKQREARSEFIKYCGWIVYVPRVIFIMLLLMGPLYGFFPNTIRLLFPFIFTIYFVWFLFPFKYSGVGMLQDKIDSYFKMKNISNEALKAKALEAGIMSFYGSIGVIFTLCALTFDKVGYSWIQVVKLLIDL